MGADLLRLIVCRDRFETAGTCQERDIHCQCPVELRFEIPYLHDDFLDTLQRFPPSFSLDRGEVERLASHGCPPDFINLIMHCVEVRPEDRPAMPQVLERLRKMEIEILSRLTFGKGEHVGSIKIVKGRGRTGHPAGARGLASFFDKREGSVAEEAEHFQDAKEHQNEFEYDTEEEEVAKMMEGSIKVEHGGRATTTWRTARWDEPHAEKQTVMDLFNNPPGKPGRDITRAS